MPIFSKEPHDKVSNIGETHLIRLIQEWLGTITPPSPLGIGDDCAVLPPHSKNTLVTTDSVILGQHFEETSPPNLVGQKLAHRNISDIAAMGGHPHHAFINLIASPDTSVSWLNDFFQGICNACNKYNLHINGGDVTSAPHNFFGATMTLLGSGSKLLNRTGAKLNDTLFVTGNLGGSIIDKHLTFQPRLTEGQWLASHPHVKAMIDISDGLAKDLLHITPPEHIAEIQVNHIPIHPDAHKIAQNSDHTPLHHALCDGEDYELLFAMDASIDPQPFTQEWNKIHSTPITHIGKIATQLPNNKARIRLFENHKEYTLTSHPNGFEHFQS